MTNLDLWLVALGCLAGALAAAFEAPWPIRLPLGLVAVFALPGYILSLLAFRPGQVDLVERAALSFSLSICLMLVLAPILDRLPGGITPTTIVTNLMTTTLVATGVVWLQRGGGNPRADDAEAAPRRPWTRSMTLTAIAGSLVVGIVVVALATTLSTPPARATEFYVVAPDGSAAGIPAEVVVGSELDLLAGITSHESGQATFRIDVRLADRSIAAYGPIAIASGEAWTGPLSFTLGELADDLEVQLLLFRGEETVAYRSLRLTLDVVEVLSGAPSPGTTAAPP